MHKNYLQQYALRRIKQVDLSIKDVFGQILHHLQEVHYVLTTTLPYKTSWTVISEHCLSFFLLKLHKTARKTWYKTTFSSFFDFVNSRSTPLGIIIIFRRVEIVFIVQFVVKTVHSNPFFWNWCETANHLDSFVKIVVFMIKIRFFIIKNHHGTGWEITHAECGSATSLSNYPLNNQAFGNSWTYDAFWYRCSKAPESTKVWQNWKS